MSPEPRRTLSRRGLLATTLVAGMAGLGVSCGSSEGDGDEDELSTADRRRTSTARAKKDATATPEPAPAGEITLLNLLGAIPNSDGNRAGVYLNHYGRGAAAAGVASYPARHAASKEVIAFATALVKAGVSPAEISGLRQLERIDEWRAEVGFSFEQIEADAYAGNPPLAQQVLYGAFSADAIETAVTSEPVWSSVLSRQAYQGVPYYAWGEELAVDLKKRTAVRPLGRGDCMAASDGRVFWTAKHTAMAEIISVETGVSNSLVRSSAFKLIVEAMEKRDAYAAGLTSSGTRFRLEGRPSIEPSLLEKVAREARLPVFGAIGYGAYANDKGAYVVVAAHYDARADAKKAAEALADRLGAGTSLRTAKQWAEIFAGPNVVAVEGNVVVADIPTTNPALWREIFNSGDSLTLVE